MKCELLFPQPLWIEETRINNDLLLRLTNKIHKMDPRGRSRSNRGGWQSNDIHSGEHPEMAALESTISNLSQSCLNDLGVKGTVDLHNFWININRNNEYNDVHVHPGALLSGVYYIKCSSKSGEVVFPRNFNEGFILGNLVESKPTIFNQIIAKFSPRVGTVYMFMAHAPHYVEPNLDSEPRISIAFNVGIK